MTDPMLPWLTETPPDLLAGVRDTSLAKLVRDEMLALILRGELVPGQRINENAGVFVRTLAAKEVADLYELRSVLDGHAGRRAAGLPGTARRVLVKRLSAFMRDMKAHARRHDVQAYYASNLAFHWAVVETADNEALARTYRGIVQQLHLSRLKNLSRDIGMQVSLVEHAQIVAALADGDAERCQALQAGHVTASHGRLVARLERLNQNPTEDTP
jgi:DNA-binding GntR family transcriptional regulator